ncbi:type VI immunity family protein [Corallococcus terminator]
MSEHFPRIRIEADKQGYIVVRDGLTFCFYFHRAHEGLGPAILQALERFQRALPPRTLTLQSDSEGYWRTLKPSDWEHIQRSLLQDEWPQVSLISDSIGVPEFSFSYSGGPLDVATGGDSIGRTCVATFSLPTEYLEQQGPKHVRELALEIAASLPFTSGYASLCFNAPMVLVGVYQRVRELAFRHPGMEIIDDFVSQEIGSRVRGAHWLTFLGQPLLSALGGASKLRARLSTPGIEVLELDDQRAVISLGTWPEAGDSTRGATLPAYRELARILEPWLYHRDSDTLYNPDFPPEEQLRWERRFLD